MKAIVLYLVLTFSLTYLSHGLLAYLTRFDYIEFSSLLGQTLFILGGSSPTVFAFVFIFHPSNHTLRKSLKEKLFSLRYPSYLWVFAIGLPLLLGGVFQLFYLLLKPHTFSASLPFFAFVFVLFTSIIFGGIEEIGWRGFVQEKLSDYHNLITISVVIGVIWGLWHVPLFFIESVGHSTYRFLPFILGAIMFSTYLTWLYARSKSLLLVVLFHASINASATIGFRLIFTDTLLTYILLLMLILPGIGLLYQMQKNRFKHNRHSA